MSQNQPTPDEAISELQRRRRARSSLADYIEYVSGKTPARHMRFLCHKLEKAMVSKDHRLLICEPPGHAKSFITSHHFPAWYLSKFPTHNIVAVSHTDDFAEDWGRKVRNLMLGDEHRTLFPEVVVSEDSRAAGRWNIIPGGSYYAKGVGGAVTGRRANCVAASTMVETLNGPMRIQDIETSASPCYVLSYDTARKDAASPVYRRVVAVARRTAPNTLRIYTASGNVVETTGDHLVFTAKGFVKAEAINPGDVLLRAVQQKLQPSAVRSIKKNTQGKFSTILQSFLCHSFKQRTARVCATKIMQWVLCPSPNAQSRWYNKIRLFLGVPQCGFEACVETSASQEGKSTASMRDVFNVVFCGSPHKNWPILFKRLQKYWTQQVDVWSKKSNLQAWATNQSGCEKKVRQSIYNYAINVATSTPHDSEARRQKMRRMFCGRETSRTSYKYEAYGQQAAKPSDFVQAMPREFARERAFKAESDIVSMVEVVRKESLVYDIEVEGTNTFFADGILVHNCILIDDPIRGIEDADSQTVRDKLWSWYAADLSTRLIPGGIIILIQTRWHLDDLAGRLVASESNGGDKWEKVILPAIATKNDPLGRKEGEALWPEWQSLAALEKIKRQPAMTSRVWESLYQQSPVSEAGNIIKRDWIKMWRSKEPPECKYIIQSWDTAITAKENSAYSSCLTFGVFDEPETGNAAMILLSRWRGRVDYHDLKAMARRLHHNYLDDRQDMPMRNPSKMSPDILLIEDEATGKPLLAEFARAGIQAFAFQSRKYGNKDARLQLSLDILESGRLYVPAIPPMFTQPRKFADEFITSLTAYPATKSRDDVDALSQAIIRLKTSGWIYQPEDKPPEPAWRQSGPREAIY